MLHLQKLQIDLSLLLKYILHFVSIESKLVKTLSEPQIAVLFDFCFVFPPHGQKGEWLTSSTLTLRGFVCLWGASAVCVCVYTCDSDVFR